MRSLSFSPGFNRVTAAVNEFLTVSTVFLMAMVAEILETAETVQGKSGGRQSPG
jgi:hypothetical protein